MLHLETDGAWLFLWPLWRRNAATTTPRNAVATLLPTVVPAYTLLYIAKA